MSVGDEEENVVEYFAPTKIQYTWKSTGESMTPKSTKRHAPAPPQVTVNSATSSPATKSRLNSSSNNPFLLEDNADTYNDVNTSEFSYLFERKTSEEDGSEVVDGSLIDVSNFSDDSNQDEQCLNNVSKRMTGKQHPEHSNQQLVLKTSSEKNIQEKIKPQRPPRKMSSKNTQASPLLTSQKTQTTPRNFNSETNNLHDNLSNQRQHENIRLVSSSYTALNKGPRVYGKNYKYMKGYIKTVVKQPSDLMIVESSHRRREKSPKRRDDKNHDRNRSTTKNTKHTRTLSSDNRAQPALDNRSIQRMSVQRSSEIIEQSPTESSGDEVISAKFEQENQNGFSSIDYQENSQIKKVMNQDSNRYNLRNNRTTCPPTQYNDNEEEEGHRKLLKLQQELKSAKRKIEKLYEINSLALNRKDELQREVLDAYKKISKLEIDRKSHQTNENELSLEIDLVKQRIGDAEREASQAIGHASKLERELNDVENKRKRFYDELSGAENRIKTLEDELTDTKKQVRNEILEKNKLSEQLEREQKEVVCLTERCRDLETTYAVTEDSKASVMQQLEIASKEKIEYNLQIEKLEKTNMSLKDDLRRLQTKYEVSQRTVEQCTSRIKEQKDKFDSLISTQSDLERDFRETKSDLSRQRIENNQYSKRCQDLMERLSESKSSLSKSKEECQILRSENRKLKDKVLHLEIYNQKTCEKSEVPVSTRHRFNVDSTSGDVETTLKQRHENRTSETELEEISHRLQHLKHDHDSLHKEAFKTHVSSHSNQNKHSPILLQQKQNGSLPSKHHTYSLSETSENDSSPRQTYDHNTIQQHKTSSRSKEDGVRFQIIDENQTISQHDDTFELKTDDSCYSPLELEIDLEDRPTIYPSFVASLQNNDLQNNESNFSDLLQTGNNDIANALM